ncbi:MAG: ABC transporter ATP-binding protein [Elusimicrobiota bacterium]|nr:ABC transporter ATP-binding protein [Endomicrobiia bacterium]MDW8165212.1 ABC transporter ATP-binding protein [Elusimicrobiota bacterium]
MESILEIRNLNVSFFVKSKNKKLFILRDINLEIFKTQKIAIVGESASGKTTLANTIMLLNDKEYTYYSGFVKFYPIKNSCSCQKKFYEIITVNGKTQILDEKNMRHLRGNHISMVFQDPFSALNPVVSVGKQVEEVIKNHNYNLSKKDIYNKVIELFYKVKLPQPEHIYNKYPHQLSGGQIQRICIGIALANKPEILIADEPTTALDASLKDTIINLLTELVVEENSALILITHDINLIKNSVDYVFILYAGEIVEYASAKEIFENPKHPYTTLLLECSVDKTKKGKKLTTIPYDFPDLTDEEVFKKCIFFNRCPKKIKDCEFIKPNFYSFGQHKVKCILYENER